MGNQKRILIVDDDSSIRRSLGRILRRHDYVTDEACDGVQAMQILAKSAPDLVILDIRMPGVDGVDVFSQIRQSLPSVPAIFMTAYSTSERADAANEAGGLCVMPKPLAVDRLLAMVQSAVRPAPVHPTKQAEDDRRSARRTE